MGNREIRLNVSREDHDNSVMESALLLREGSLK